MNRIDDLVIFNRLTRQAVREIVDVRVKEVEGRLKDKDVKLDIGTEAREWLAEEGYDPVYGEFLSMCW